MRRQYHSRCVDGHRLIWDIHRLVNLTKEFPIKTVPLAEIGELDESFWFPVNSGATCQAIAEHAKLIQETDLAYPIILAADGRGMHPVCKALIEDRRTIAAVQFERNPDPDYIDADIQTLPHDEPA